MAAATRLRSGHFVAQLASSEHTALALYGRSGEYIGLLRFPYRPTRYPSDSDVEAAAAEFRRAFGMEPSKSELSHFRSRPLSITQRASLFRVVQEDGRGWLWVLTTIRTPAGTELDVFDGTEYRGTITLPDHVLGIQIIADTLLALAEVDGQDRLVPTRRLDWYEIVR